MKKILVLSNSHSYFDKALKIFEKEKPDIVIGAGDGIKDIDAMVRPLSTARPSTWWKTGVWVWSSSSERKTLPGQATYRGGSWASMTCACTGEV